MRVVKVCVLIWIAQFASSILYRVLDLHQYISPRGLTLVFFHIPLLAGFLLGFCFLILGSFVFRKEDEGKWELVENMSSAGRVVLFVGSIGQVLLGWAAGFFVFYIVFMGFGFREFAAR